MDRKLSATDHMEDFNVIEELLTFVKSNYIFPSMKEALTTEEVEQFVQSGYVKIENVFSKELAERGRTILWKDTGCDPNNPSTWFHPVIRLGDYPQELFRLAVNAPILHKAADQLVGKGRWVPRGSLGSFPIRFPSDRDPGDTGWHADASFYGSDGSMRLNLKSSGRALLMLFLFSDVSLDDAPTRILVGSHLDIPKLLQPAGDYGLPFIELAQKFTSATLDRDVVYATGQAGTVFLCHPFLIHAAQPHRGKNPRFLAQPPLIPRDHNSIKLVREDSDYSPVEVSILKGLR